MNKEINLGVVLDCFCVKCVVFYFFYFYCYYDLEFIILFNLKSEEIAEKIIILNQNMDAVVARTIYKDRANW